MDPTRFVLLFGLGGDPAPQPEPLSTLPAVYQVTVPMPCTRRHADDQPGMCYPYTCECGQGKSCLTEKGPHCRCNKVPSPTIPATSPAPPPTPAAGPIASPPATRPARPAAGPTLYQLRDTSGQVWTHADPNWLRTWVCQVNARLAAPRPFAPVNPFGVTTTCPNGRCPR